MSGKSDKKTNEETGHFIIVPENALANAIEHVAAERYSDAEVALIQCLSADPDNEDAQIWLAVVQARTKRKMGDVPGAIAKYQEALEIDPTNREALEELESLEQQRRATSNFFSRFFRKGGK